MSVNPIWKGAHANNYAAGRGGEQPSVVIIHVAQTATLDQLAGWFNNPNAGVTAHYGTGQDGKVYRFVKEEDTAFANGILNKPNMAIPWVAKCVQDNPAFTAKNNYGIANARSFSIENCGFTGNPVPVPQWQALVELVADICNRWCIPVDNQHIIRHADVDSVNRGMCPGTGFDMTKLVRDVKAAMSPTPAAPQQNFNPNPNNYSVGSGVLTEMDARGDVAATDEQFYSPSGGKAGLAQRSFTWAENGRLYIGFQQLNPDGTPSQVWEVQVWQKLP